MDNPIFDSNDIGTRNRLSETKELTFNKNDKNKNAQYSLQNNDIPQDRNTTIKDNGENTADIRAEYLPETTNCQARKITNRHMHESSFRDCELKVIPPLIEHNVNQSTHGNQSDDDIARLLPASNAEPTILIERTVFSQKHFDENFESGLRPLPSLKEIIKKAISNCLCSRTCFQRFLLSLFPFIHILKSYNIRTDVAGDIISGLTVGVMHIPQGLAYGLLTTLPAIYGLYTSFFPVLVYFFFGTSKHISVGTFAVSCIMVGTAVTKGYDSLSHPAGATSVSINGTNGTNATVVATASKTMSPEEIDLRLQFAMSVTFLAGIIQLVMGTLKLGFVTVYLSDALISGFTTGTAVHVFTSLIKDVFGVKTGKYSGVLKLVYTYRDFFVNIETTNHVTIIVSAICMVVLYCVTRFINQNPKLKPRMFMPVPIELIVVVLGTVISYFIKLETKFKVVVISDLPTGLPGPSLHGFTRLQNVIGEAVALAIVVFAISISMGKLLAKKHDYEVNANQELVAIGISTIVSSFFHSVAPSVSLSRSLIQESVGGKTQVAGLVSCCLLLVVLLVIGPYFRTLPNCVLASILIVSLRGMFMQIFDLKKYWNVSMMDFWVWLVAFLATVLMDVDLGLGVAVAFNILTVAFRSQRPYVTLLGRMQNTEIYRDINVYHDAKEIPGIKIVRFEHSLFFVNTEHFRNQLYKRTVNPRTLRIAQKKRQVILAKQQKKEHDAVVEIENVANVKLRAAALRLNLVATPNNKINGISETEDKVPSCPPDIDFHTVILDCSTWAFVDTMGIKVLSSIVGEFVAVGVRVFLANCKAGLREMFQKSKFYKTLNHAFIFIYLHDAVAEALHHRSLAVEEKAEENQYEDEPDFDEEFSIRL